MNKFDAKDKKSHSEFLKWMKNNPEGFFLNDKGTEGFVLHKSNCGHLKFKKEVSLTTNKKFCSMDRNELEHYAKKNSSTILKLCSTCAP
jgi:hypothetical protein